MTNFALQLVERRRKIRRKLPSLGLAQPPPSRAAFFTLFTITQPKLRGVRMGLVHRAMYSDPRDTPLERLMASYSDDELERYVSTER